MQDILSELPMGFGMALARNTDAMERFASLSEQQQQEIIGRTHSVQSKRKCSSLSIPILQERGEFCDDSGR